jgi:putative thioredoxin
MLEGLIGARAAKQGTASDEIVKDVDTRSFEQDVLLASREVPVLVDFWAPWCGPCKQLGPALEKVVRAAGGKVRLVKINIDENQALAQQLRIQSVPTVYAFVGGQPVDGFMGALPESQLKAFVERLAGPVGPTAEETGLDAAKVAADAGDLARAAQLFERVLQQTPDDPVAIAGLARAQLGAGRLAEAEATLERVPAEQKRHVDIEGVGAALTLAREAGQLPSVDSLMMRLEADPNDHAARRDLALALFLRGQIEQAVDECIRIVKQDRAWEDDGGRKTLVRFFEALGPAHPATVQGRRKLSAVLFA